MNSHLVPLSGAMASTYHGFHFNMVAAAGHGWHQQTSLLDGMMTHMLGALEMHRSSDNDVRHQHAVAAQHLPGPMAEDVLAGPLLAGAILSNLAWDLGDLVGAIHQTITQIRSVDDHDGNAPQSPQEILQSLWPSFRTRRDQRLRNRLRDLEEEDITMEANNNTAPPAGSSNTVVLLHRARRLFTSLQRTVLNVLLASREEEFTPEVGSRQVYVQCLPFVLVMLVWHLWMVLAFFLTRLLGMEDIADGLANYMQLSIVVCLEEGWQLLHFGAEEEGRRGERFVSEELRRVFFGVRSTRAEASSIRLSEEVMEDA